MLVTNACHAGSFGSCPTTPLAIRWSFTFQVFPCCLATRMFLLHVIRANTHAHASCYKPTTQGHGSQQRDYTGEEADGMNETILPTDHRSAGQIVDDVRWVWPVFCGSC